MGIPQSLWECNRALGNTAGHKVGARHGAAALQIIPLWGRKGNASLYFNPFFVQQGSNLGRKSRDYGNFPAAQRHQQSPRGRVRTVG